MPSREVSGTPFTTKPPSQSRKMLGSILLGATLTTVVTASPLDVFKRHDYDSGLTWIAKDSSLPKLMCVTLTQPLVTTPADPVYCSDTSQALQYW